VNASVPMDLPLHGGGQGAERPRLQGNDGQNTSSIVQVLANTGSFASASTSGALFGSKDHCSPQSDWDEVLPSSDLGLAPLYLHKAGKLKSYVLCHVLKGDHLAISELRYGTLRDLSNLLPARGRSGHERKGQAPEGARPSAT
jgi:hypothetical protein